MRLRFARLIAKASVLSRSAAVFAGQPYPTRVEVRREVYGSQCERSERYLGSVVEAARRVHRRAAQDTETQLSGRVGQVDTGSPCQPVQSTTVHHQVAEREEEYLSLAAAARTKGIMNCMQNDQ